MHNGFSFGGVKALPVQLKEHDCYHERYPLVPVKKRVAQNQRGSVTCGKCMKILYAVAESLPGPIDSGVEPIKVTRTSRSAEICDETVVQRKHYPKLDPGRLPHFANSRSVFR